MSSRTVSASILTENDKFTISVAEQISKRIKNNINSDEMKKDFHYNFGKISYTRDSGIGLGGGKLQRDALTTRGKTGKTPLSNRNLRWHPLVVSETEINFAEEIKKIEIDNTEDFPTLIFVIDFEGKEYAYPSNEVHELPKRYVCLPKHWDPHHDVLKNWSVNEWTENNCLIPALEACNWYDAIETYAILSLAQGVANYNCNFNEMYEEITDILIEAGNKRNFHLPTDNFKSNRENILKCPVCKRNLSESIDIFRTEERVANWNPGWTKNKRSEGRDSALQILHSPLPLIGTEIRHNASNIRYGHRWCNIMMTDHTLEDFVNFSKYIVNKNKFD